MSAIYISTKPVKNWKQFGFYIVLKITEHNLLAGYTFDPHTDGPSYEHISDGVNYC